MPPRPRPLRNPSRSLAHRLGRVADSVRQIATDLGARPYRVFLTWTKWGLNRESERGDGYERLVARCEILPTPLVTSLDGVSFSIFHAGTIPVGSVRVGEVSVRNFDEDVLRGLRIPRLEWLEVGSCDECAPCRLPEVAELRGTAQDTVAEPYRFFYEVVEDTRQQREPVRNTFRLLNKPNLVAENAEWTLMLQRVSYDQLRDGKSPFAQGLPPARR